jgi:hypothetical protein
MQMTALEDWSVSDKLEWDAATKFLEVTLQSQLNEGIMFLYIVVTQLSGRNLALMYFSIKETA